MPTYEYRCRSCAHRFERFQSITARPLRRCPKCGKGVERLIGSGAGIIFKGSGFYQTDYRSESYRQQARKESGESAGPAGGKADGAAKGAKGGKSGGAGGKSGD